MKTIHRKMHLHFQLALLFSPFAFANVEKTIFLGPPAISIPAAHPNLDDLSLIPLTPLYTSVRTRLNASFPSDNAPKGNEHWLLLDGLSPGARYEVRICWLATQPTAFSLYTFTLTEVFDSPELLGSLSTYAYSRLAAMDELEHQKLVARRAVLPTTSLDSVQLGSSILFLHVFAAADYYTLDKTLMENVPPVLVDIILDPYLFNVFPKSLLPTAGYVTLVAVASWFLSGYIWRLIMKLNMATNAGQPEKLRKHEKTS